MTLFVNSRAAYYKLCKYHALLQDLIIILEQFGLKTDTYKI